MIAQEAISGERVEAGLEAVFSRPEFAELEVPWLLRFQEAAQEWVLQMAGRFLGWILEFLAGVGALQGASPLLFWSLVLVSLILIGFALREVVLAIGRRRGPSEGDVEPAPGDDPFGESVGVAEWEERARTALAEGRLRDATRALYASLVLRLQSRGALEVDPAKTAGDYRREAGSHDPSIGMLVERFVRLFEPAAYGAPDPGEAAVWEMARLAREAGARV